MSVAYPQGNTLLLQHMTEGSLFWSGSDTSDMISLLMLLALLLVAPVYVRMPGLYGRLWAAFRFGREDRLLEEVAHVMPLSLFKGTVRAISSLLLALFCIQLLELQGLLIEYALPDTLLLIPMLWVLFALFFLLRRLAYRLIGMIYLPPDIWRRWAAGYQVSEWLWLPFLALGIVASLSPRIEPAALGIAIGAFLLWRILVIVRTIGAFRLISRDYLLLFLYLCAHEVVPFALLYRSIVDGIAD